MGMYEIVLRGENFLIEHNGQKARMSFYASRIVEEETLAKAELAAVDLIRRQLAEEVLNKRADTPTISMEGYNLVTARDEIAAPGADFLFFLATPRQGQAERPRPSPWRRWLEKD